MGSFFRHLVAFHVLNGVSLLFSGLLFVIFRTMNQNILVQSASVISLLTSMCLFLGVWMGDSHIRNFPYCVMQGIFLNYCFVSFHAHFCFLMWSNLILAMGWRVFGVKDARLLAGLMSVMSLAFPVVPTIIIFAYSLEFPKSSNFHIEPKPFYCTVNQPSWLGYRIWFGMFSVPGIIAASIVFYRTVRSRRKMLLYSNTSQVGRIQLFRLFSAIIIYLVMALTSMMVGFSPEFSDGPFQVKVPPAANPFLREDFCDQCPTTQYWCYTLCPRLKTYLPALAGIVVFSIYGVGTVATAYYKKVYASMLVADEGGNVTRANGEAEASSYGGSTNRRLSSIGRRRSSKSSSIGSDSPSSIASRRPSGVVTRSRKASKTLDELDEEFIYDLPKVKAGNSPPHSPSSLKKTGNSTFRRGSEPTIPSPLEDGQYSKDSLFPTIMENQEEHEDNEDGQE